MDSATFVMPGDGIAQSLPSRGIVQLGSGVDLRSSSHSTIAGISSPGEVSQGISATEVGVVLQTTPGKEKYGRPGEALPLTYTVVSLHKKAYAHPSLRDSVIGCVVKTGADYYEVDIRATTPALLPVLGFDNATKRNRPMLKVGDVVYGKITEVDGIAGGGYAVERVMMDCRNDSSGDGFGPLYVSPVSASIGAIGMTGSNSNNSGMLFQVTPAYARYLLRSGTLPQSTLAILGSRIPFEIVVGVNGLFWISSSNSPSSAHLETSILGTVIQCMERDNDVSPEHVLSVLEKRIKSAQ